MLWEQNQAVRERVGCPLTPEAGGDRTTTEQQFEHGSMFYFQPNDRIYVLLGRDSGTWRLFKRSDIGDLPTPTPADQPPCPSPMDGGFALVWSTQQDIRAALGCSMAPMPDLFEGAFQAFEHGTMLYSRVGLGRGKTLYVLYADNTFERYDDPNQ